MSQEYPEIQIITGKKGGQDFRKENCNNMKSEITMILDTIKDYQGKILNFRRRASLSEAPNITPSRPP